MKKNIFIVAGEGGHYEQALRLRDIFLKKSSEEAVLIVSERKTKQLDHASLYNVSKDSKFDSTAWVKSRVIMLSVANSIRFSLLLIRYRPIGVVFLGPLFCVPLAVVTKLFGLKTVYIETWSKFLSPTKSGKYCCKVVDKHYYQNKELTTCYPKGVYSGRL